MTVTTRRARPADAAAIAALNAGDLGYDHPVDATADALADALASPREVVLVAEVDGRVVGYVHGEDYRLLYEPLLVNVLGIAVSARRVGAGSALMAALEAWAVERGASGLRLVSGTARTEAHAFYERLGFTSTKTQRNYRKPLAGWTP